jgi:hypothetical protein
MPNKRNLIPINKRTKSEARELSKKGGQKSGESRRQRKKLRDHLRELLSLEEEDGLTVQDKILRALVRQSQEGNVRAFEVIRDTIGEKPIEKTENLNPIAIVNNNLPSIEKLAELRERLKVES